VPEDFNKLLNEHLNNEMLPSKGSIIETEILQVNSDFVIVDVGAKQEAFISRKEFQVIPTIGTKIKAFVENSSTSQVKLSLSKALKFENIATLEEKFEKQESVEGVIKKLTNNGYLVDIMGWEAFLPFSQVTAFGGLKEEDKKNYINQKYPFVILKMKEFQGNNSFLVSLKQALNQNQRIITKDFLENLAVGTILDGKVIKLNEKSVLVEIAPNILGLVKIGDISWDRIKDPSDKLKMGDKVSVKVLNVDLEKLQVLLSIKDANNQYWTEFIKAHPLNSVVKGKIQVIKDQFMIIWFTEGVKGFLHRSNIDWLSSPQLHKEFKVDQEIECKIIEINEEKQQIGLGIKQLNSNPWETLAQKYPLGAPIEGAIVKITDFALFIEIESGIPVMLHKNDLSWNSHEQNLKNYSLGQNISCKISKVDVQNQKISCSIKNTEANPWQSFAQKYSNGSVLKASVKKVESAGYILDLDFDIEAFLSFSHTPKDKEFAVGDTLEILLTEFNMKKRIIKVSMKALQTKETKKILENYLTDANNTEVKAPTLGDVFNFNKK
jgi:small subunit ribosomal protein S1